MSIRDRPIYVYYSTPEAKQQSRQWTIAGESSAKKAKIVLTVKGPNILYVVPVV